MLEIQYYLLINMIFVIENMQKPFKFFHRLYVLNLKIEKKIKVLIEIFILKKGDITMTVIFVAPDDSDEENLSNCEENNHLKYKFITNETE